MPNGQWSFVALTVTPSNAVISLMNASGIVCVTNSYPNPVQSFGGATMIGDDPADTTGARSFPGTIDDVAVFNTALSFSQLTSLFSAASGIVDYPPDIGVQAAPLSLYPALTAQFTVVAGGSGTLTYQWLADTAGNGIYVRLTNGLTSSGAVISGADSATLSIAGIGAANGNDYEVIVSGPYGSPVTSAPVFLTLLPIGAAQNITMINYATGMPVQEPAGTDWNTAANWSDDLSAIFSAAAYPGSSFEVLPGEQLRSVNNSQAVVFPGQQLTIDGTNSVYTTTHNLTNNMNLVAELLLNHAGSGQRHYLLEPRHERGAD